MTFSVSVGPQPTPRQARQREDTEAAAILLRQHGYQVKVVLLLCGERFPNDDAAMLTIQSREG